VDELLLWPPGWRSQIHPAVKQCSGLCQDFPSRINIAETGHPPDKQEKAAQTILEQTELLSKDWAA
jgi:hypothetical protein